MKYFFQIIIYEINRAKGRHKLFRSILLPQPPQSLDILGEGRLAVGFQSAFTIYSILGDQQPLCKLKRFVKDNPYYFDLKL